MSQPYREQLIALLEDAEKDVPPFLQPCIEQLRKMNWSNDLAALSRLSRFAPGLVDRYLDLMVSELHETPEFCS